MKKPILLLVIIAFASLTTIDKSNAAENTRSHDVTFNVNMTDAAGFNPGEHTVYLTGTFSGWAEPGTSGSITMQQLSNREDNLVYTATVQLAAGQHQYKYFSDAFGTGWAGGEWAGDPNRVIHVTSDMTINNIWGIIDDQPEGYTVTFHVIDANGDQITDATITLGGNQNNMGNYVFHDIYPGIYDYTVAKDGYVTYHGQIQVVDSDLTQTVTLVEGTTPHYQISFLLNMAEAIAEGDVVFDPDIHEVYITGTFTEWAMPGTDEGFRMQPINRDQEWYAIVLPAEAGMHAYKYFLTASEATWDIGEWAGDPNRSISVNSNMPVFNRFGDVETYSVTLDILDIGGNPLYGANISINGIENAPGVYSFHYLATGTYELIVEKAGYVTHYQQIIVEDDDLEISIIMEAEEEIRYSLTFIVENPNGQTVDNAIITLNAVANSPGDYVFENLQPGSYSYVVEKSGYESAQGEVVITDQNINKLVVLTPIETSVFNIREPEISIYPNPVSSILHIDSPDDIIISATMLDMLGRIVYNTHVGDYNYEINVLDLKNGIYFLRINLNHGIITQRIQVTN